MLLKRQWDAVEGTRKAAPLHTLLFPEIHVSILISFLFIFLQAHSMLHIWRFIWLCLSALKTKWTCNDSVRVRLNYVSMEAKHRSNKIYYSSERIDRVSDFSGYLSINNAKYDDLYFPFLPNLQGSQFMILNYPFFCKNKSLTLFNLCLNCWAKFWNILRLGFDLWGNGILNQTN